MVLHPDNLAFSPRLITDGGNHCHAVTILFLCVGCGEQSTTVTLGA